MIGQPPIWPPFSCLDPYRDCSAWQPYWSSSTQVRSCLSCSNPPTLSHLIHSKRQGSQNSLQGPAWSLLPTPHTHRGCYLSDLRASSYTQVPLIHRPINPGPLHLVFPPDPAPIANFSSPFPSFYKLNFLFGDNCQFTYSCKK